MKVLNQIENQFQQEKPFVVYRKPNANLVSGWFCKTKKLTITTNFTESGFVFAPFDNKEPAILFSSKEVEKIEEEFSTKSPFQKKTIIEKATSNNLNYEKLIQKTIAKIHASELQKIVISRKELVEIGDFNLVKIYQKMLETYPTAFVYVWYHPNVGLWLGATPETLLEMHNNYFKTMSLAGTQLAKTSEVAIWGAKEIEEQQLVTDFIAYQVKNITQNLQVSSAKTVKAGALLHLKSSIEGQLTENKSLKALVDALHPTPAVCGLPRELAKNFILQNEGYSRKFYTGFLGEINQKKQGISKTHLFVNLRCMEISDTKAVLYVGGGITKDSIPEKEWQETVSKTSTIKTILQ